MKSTPRKAELRDTEQKIPDDAKHLDADVPEITGVFFPNKMSQHRLAEGNVNWVSVIYNHRSLTNTFSLINQNLFTHL